MVNRKEEKEESKTNEPEGLMQGKITGEVMYDNRIMIKTADL